jgi:hypothetical protein
MFIDGQTRSGGSQEKGERGECTAVERDVLSLALSPFLKVTVAQ